MLTWKFTLFVQGSSEGGIFALFLTSKSRKTHEIMVTRLRFQFIDINKPLVRTMCQYVFIKYPLKMPLAPSALLLQFDKAKSGYGVFCFTYDINLGALILSGAVFFNVVHPRPQNCQIHPYFFFIPKSPTKRALSVYHYFFLFNHVFQWLNDTNCESRN